MATIRPLRDELPEPIPLDSRAADNLRYIRETMARASAFTAVPGWGLVAMGATAVVAALVGARMATHEAWLWTWLAEAAIAIPLSVGAMWRKARANGESLLAGPGRKFLASFTPACVAGAILTAVLAAAGQWAAIPGTWLLLYGVGVAAAGAFSVRIVPVMGLAFMAFGAGALLSPETWRDMWLAFGFGLGHVVFGTWIARNHGG